MNLTLLQNLTEGYRTELLYIISIISIFLGLSIIITKNPIFSVLFLIGLFGSIAIYLVLVGLEFIGLSYILVYVGAISILFLFILMLINIRVSELITEDKNSLILALLAVLAFNLPINKVIPYNLLTFYFDYTNIFSNLNNSVTRQGSKFNIVLENTSENKLASISTKSWDDVLVQISQISAVGNILYTNVFMYLITISLILLLAMVGAIVITVKRLETNDLNKDN